MGAREGLADSQPDRRPRLSGSFGFRLLATLVVTLVVVGGVRYGLTVDSIEDRLHDETISGLERQASAIALAHGAHADDGMAIEMARSIIDGMLTDPGTRDVALFGPGGQLVVEAGSASSDGGHGPADHDHHHHATASPRLAATAQQVIAAGEPVVTTADDAHAEYELWVPVQLAGQPHALHVGLDASIVQSAVSEARRASLMVVLSGVPIGTAVFFLLGGRGLVRRHRRAVDHATRDALTGLGNHRAFQEDVRRALARASRQGQSLACALIDIDNFKGLNDQLGHSFGDDALTRVAAELSAMRAGDTAYRIGGDEFAVVMEAAGTDEVVVALERVRRVITERLSNVTISVGVAATDRPGIEANDLIERADVALYGAKHAGRNRIECFHDDMWNTRDVSPGERRTLERILATDGVDVVLQPIFELDGMGVLGYEALARFRDDDGTIAPGPVFDAAHRLGQVHELDALCRRAAFRVAHEVPGQADLFVNVSPEVFAAGETLAETLASEVAAAGVPPHRVVIEVTEQRVVNPARLVVAIRALRDAGFRVALDDVGAGNAGLELLRLVELDIVKIDRSVVTGAIQPGPARGVLLAVLAFARESGCHVVAEGIETHDVLAFVDAVGAVDATAPPLRIHAAQGYLLGRPAAASTWAAAPSTVGR